MQERYARNIGAFSKEEWAAIRAKRVLVVGCGGLGGHVCQSLARFGVGGLTVVDGDVFNPSNLNRQIFCTEHTLGRNKAVVVREVLAGVNPDVAVEARPVMLAEENAAPIVAGHHVAVDCLDNIPARFLLARHCAEAGIPLVHGAIGGFYGQVANIFPGDNLLETIYPARTGQAEPIEKRLGTPPFAPQLVGAVQSCEALKLLAGRAEVLRGELLHIDMLNNTYERVKLL